MKWNVNEILVGSVFGFLGVCVGAGLMFWAKLPDHTIDLLTFSESAFGIGMTVIALIFALVTVNQIKEIDRRFVEISKDIDEQYSTMQNGVEEQYNTMQDSMKESIYRSISALDRETSSVDSFLYDAKKELDDTLPKVMRSRNDEFGKALDSIRRLDRRIQALEKKQNAF